MPVLSIPARVLERVRAGDLKSGIYFKQYITVRPGDSLYLYSNYGRPNSKHIGESTCLSAAPVTLTMQDKRRLILLDKVILNEAAALTIAQGDGFTSVKELFNHYKYIYGLPYSGQYIVWS